MALNARAAPAAPADGHHLALAIARELAPFVIAAVVLFVVAPAILSDFRLNLLAKFLCYAILAVGIDLIWGYTGILSLGQAVWFGLGGYAMAMYLKLQASGDSIPDFMNWSGLNSLPWFWEPFRYGWFALPLTAIGPGALAFVLGYLVFRSRVKGAYFAIITQALALILSIFFVGQQQFTGGTNGLTNFDSFFGMPLATASTQQTLYFITVAVLLTSWALAVGITRSPFGRILIAIRDEEDRVRFAGYNVGLIKAVVFALSAAFAGVAGALFVPQVGIISPANLGIVPSIEFVLLVAVGGRGTLTGAVVGAIVVGWARSSLSEAYPDTWQYFYGGLFVGAVVLFPIGIVGAFRTLVAGEIRPREFPAYLRRRLRAPSVEIEPRRPASAD
ncbi:MAG: urea ABC transporter permease subunit UrtC [Dehalococcoidia bacterium]